MLTACFVISLTALQSCWQAHLSSSMHIFCPIIWQWKWNNWIFLHILPSACMAILQKLPTTGRHCKYSEELSLSVHVPGQSSLLEHGNLHDVSPCQCICFNEKQGTFPPCQCKVSAPFALCILVAHFCFPIKLF